MGKYLPQDLVLCREDSAQVEKDPAILDSRDNGRIAAPESRSKLIGAQTFRSDRNEPGWQD